MGGECVCARGRALAPGRAGERGVDAAAKIIAKKYRKMLHISGKGCIFALVITTFSLFFGYEVSKTFLHYDQLQHCYAQREP